MSHQTGIRGNDKLRKIFAESKSGRIRVIKVSILNEELTLTDFKEVEKSWEEDFDKMITPLIEEEQPSYILFRLDTKNESTGYDWLLISWSPDNSAVRQKMLYASTKATLKKEFGSANIKEELHGTTTDDVTLKGLKLSRIESISPAPLTTQEEELAQLRKMENMNLSNVSVTTRTQIVPSLDLNLTDELITALNKLESQEVNYIQCRIDVDRETISLVKESEIDVKSLPQQVPKDMPRYHFYKYLHKFGDEVCESIVFIYSMPGCLCPIKERMMYSSFKAGFLKIVASITKVIVVKALEIESGKELTEDFLLDEIHPKKVVDKPKFDKPKGPPGRGARRITKAQNSSS